MFFYLYNIIIKSYHARRRNIYEDAESHVDYWNSFIWVSLYFIITNFDNPDAAVGWGLICISYAIPLSIVTLVISTKNASNNRANNSVLNNLLIDQLTELKELKEKNHKKQLDSVAVGDTVGTFGGVIGKVADIKDNEVTISTSVNNTLITLDKGAVNNIIKPITE